MSKKCKCGAVPLPRTDGRDWYCGTYLALDGERVESAACVERQAQNIRQAVEALAEFHRGVGTVYHRWSTNEIDATEAMADICALLIAIPGEG